MELVREYGGFVLYNAGQAAIGGIWWSLLFCFVAFIYDYNWYYQQGVRNNIRSYKLVYDDMDKRARQIVLAFLMFLGFTFVILKLSFDGFYECLVRGLALSVIVLPLAHRHYSQPHKY